MTVRLACPADLPGFLTLAAQVEPWFGPMVDDLGFHAAVGRNIDRGTALVAVAPSGPDLLGGLLFGARPPRHHIRWLVVSEAARGQGVGRAPVDEAVRRFVRCDGTLEVETFGADHPGAAVSGARVFYERLGFSPAEPAPVGPEGGSRQVYRRPVDQPEQRPHRSGCLQP
ncbi:GNAT superfamily N-acetyltransferase [Catenulispora sp. GP43]|uniref:GNAT family N-acetyltransferase n=1 Tax=Catenulispora sp. GP43 TaxID=3156263 RepID=UPI0035138A03